MQVYAPNVDVTVTGGSAIHGSIIGYTIDMTGGSTLYTDAAGSGATILN